MRTELVYHVCDGDGFARERHNAVLSLLLAVSVSLALMESRVPLPPGHPPIYSLWRGGGGGGGELGGLGSGRKVSTTL